MNYIRYSKLETPGTCIIAVVAYAETKHRQSTVNDIYLWMATRTGKAKAKTKQTNTPKQQKSPGSLPTNTNKICQDCRDDPWLKSKCIQCHLVDRVAAWLHNSQFLRWRHAAHCGTATTIYNNKTICSYLEQREVLRKFVLDTPRIRKTLIRNDRFLDDVQKSPLQKWSRIGLCIHLMQVFISVLLLFPETI